MIGENITKLRKRYNYSQEEVAEKIGVTKKTIAQWESGESIPDVLHSNALAELFDIALDNLVNFEADEVGMQGLPPKGKYMFGTVTVGEKGQIVIPKKARDIFEIKAGDDLFIMGDEEQGIAIVKASEMLDLMHKIKDIIEKDKER